MTIFFSTRSDSREADGGAKIFGHPIKTDLDGARSVIGVCPQHNVLFELLTTREHLTFLARRAAPTRRDGFALSLPLPSASGAKSLALWSS